MARYNMRRYLPGWFAAPPRVPNTRVHTAPRSPVSFLGDAESSLGDAEGSLGDAQSSR
jgi:hypothetical protein